MFVCKAKTAQRANIGLFNKKILFHSRCIYFANLSFFGLAPSRSIKCVSHKSLHTPGCTKCLSWLYAELFFNKTS